jgi:ATP-binding cassette, subfamily C (CFTR/MRP), member 1
VLLALLIQYLLTLQQMCNYSLYNFGEIERQMVCVQRLFQLEDVPQEKTGEEIEVNAREWPQVGTVQFIDASLRYRPTTDLVLKRLSFTVEPGTKVGVVGRTGAGKSTICLSLSRIVELCEGRIEIDGVDIGKIDLQKLRSKVTVISQDPTLFTGSLRFNLDPFRRFTDKQLEALLIKAGLNDLLNREPKDDKTLNSQDD